MRTLKSFINESIYNNIGADLPKEYVLSELKKFASIYAPDSQIDMQMIGDAAVLSSSSSDGISLSGEGVPDLPCKIRFGKFGGGYIPVSIGYSDSKISESTLKDIFDKFEFTNVPRVYIRGYAGRALPDNVPGSKELYKIYMDKCPNILSADFGRISSSPDMELNFGDCPELKNIILPKDARNIDIILRRCPKVNIDNLKSKNIKTVFIASCPQIDVNSLISGGAVDSVVGYSDNFASPANYEVKDVCGINVILTSGKEADVLKNILDNGYIPKCNTLSISTATTDARKRCRAFIQEYTYENPGMKCWRQLRLS